MASLFCEKSCRFKDSYIVFVISRNQWVRFNNSTILICFECKYLSCLDLFLAPVYSFACLAHWVLGVVGQHVLLAVFASELRWFGQVGVSWREDFVFDTRVETEYSEFVLTLLVDGSSSLFALLYSPLRVGHRVFSLAHLNDRAAAVPAVRREILFPERVVDRERHVMEHGVRFADPFVGGGIPF